MLHFELISSIVKSRERAVRTVPIDVNEKERTWFRSQIDQTRADQPFDHKAAMKNKIAKNERWGEVAELIADSPRDSGIIYLCLIRSKGIYFPFISFQCRQVVNILQHFQTDI